MSDNKETVGAASLRLLENPDTKQGVVDTSREIMKKYVSSLEECVARHKDWVDPFYVVVLNRRERVMSNVIRQQFFARHSCPRSEYDQTVYHYNPSTGDLRFIWTVPDKETIIEMINKPLDIEFADMQEFCRLFVSEKLNEHFVERVLSTSDKIQVAQ